jgi:hypothetical protein
MAEEVNKLTDSFLTDISVAASEDNWKLVRKLSEKILALDPGNITATNFAKTAIRLLEQPPNKRLL